MDNQVPTNYSGTKGSKLARNSSFSGDKQPYQCRFSWPEDCFVQCGGDGVVLPHGTAEQVLGKGNLDPLSKALDGNLQGTYRTAFFEAFPNKPDTFIRGEGSTINEAELACWKKFSAIMSCQKHDFERRGRTDGYCYCKHCGLGGSFLEPMVDAKKK